MPKRHPSCNRQKKDPNAINELRESLCVRQQLTEITLIVFN